MNAHDITDFLEELAPLSYQESYDNSGWIVRTGDAVSAALITLDCTEQVVDEAIARGCNLVIAHHPIVFSGMKKFTGKTYVERAVMKAIRNGISIYAIHTNLDNISGGVNRRIGEVMGLGKLRILQPKTGMLRKLSTFVPVAHADKVRDSLFAAGAGSIGDYSECSYNSEGFGTFKPGEGADPFTGTVNERHKEPEMKVEVLFPAQLEPSIVSTLMEIHPYEEPAYDIFHLGNALASVGSGMIGELEKPADATEFLQGVKTAFNCGTIRHTEMQGKTVRKVAFCGGAGFFLLQPAIRAGADLFITSDVKYHEFFDAEDKIILADMGHFESEQFTKDLLAEEIRKKFPNFAVLISETNTNPVKYL